MPHVTNLKDSVEQSKCHHHLAILTAGPSAYPPLASEIPTCPYTFPISFKKEDYSF